MFTGAFAGYALGQIESQPVFRPFIGGRYAARLQSALNGNFSGGELECVHLLGESHYDEEGWSEIHPIEGMTANVVREFGDGGNPTLTRMMMAATGKPASEISKDSWDDYAFSNFIQRPMSGVDDRPDGSDWDIGRRAFFGQLAITRPTVLAVFGAMTWEHLPLAGGKTGAVPATEVSDAVEDLWYYPFKLDGYEHLTIAVRLYHPSSRGRFNWDEAHRRINAARYFYSNLACNLHDTRSARPANC